MEARPRQVKWPHWWFTTMLTFICFIAEMIGLNPFIYHLSNIKWYVYWTKYCDVHNDQAENLSPPTTKVMSSTLWFCLSLCSPVSSIKKNHLSLVRHKEQSVKLWVSKITIWTCDYFWAALARLFLAWLARRGGGLQEVPYSDSKVHGAKHRAHLGPTGPRWAPCWPYEPCYLGIVI